MAVSFIGEDNTDLPKVTDKLYHIMLYWVHPAWTGFKLTTLVVIWIQLPYDHGPSQLSKVLLQG